MKTLLLVIFLISSLLSFSQDSLLTELAQKNIQHFNDSITSLLVKYEAEGVDFIAMRSNHRYGPNCRFIVRKDSCSRKFILHRNEDNSITHIHVANIQSREPNDGKFRCEKDLDNMYFALTRWENYFTNQKPDYSLYDSSKVIFLGKVNGEYLNKSVDRDFFSTHHPGMFYDTFNLYF